ncbi:RNase A-like domain-containing protein [Nocardioides sp.]|uniref:RNase A-like domain-containing protein n=1 Tax=Nocardioides sp. TaxID=35761 RepID=UPI002ED43DF0
MIVAVAVDGYVEAADAFRSGNHAAADVHDRLTTGLSVTGAMAGDDGSAADFAEAYDGTATEAMAAIADVVTAFTTMHRLTSDSVSNHRRAEERSILPGGVAPTDCRAAPTDADRVVLPAAPPSSLGGDPPVLTPQEAWVLDQIEGFVWPDADVDRLRQAAHTWRTAATGLDEAASYCGLAAEALDTQRSPEIPLARSAATDLRATIRALASSCDRLAADCDAYADAVEARRAEIRALLHEILRFVVEGVVIGAALSAITAGAGAAVAAGSIAARVAAQSPRFAAVLAALRAATAGIAGSISTTRSAVQLHRTRLERYLRVPVRNERGTLALGRPGRQPGWLSKHEHSGSHTLREHVGKSVDELQERRLREGLPVASSFRDQAEAERLLGLAIGARSSVIEKWLASQRARLTFEARTETAAGLSVTADGPVTASRMRVVLARDPSMPEGFRVYTAYPHP